MLLLGDSTLTSTRSARLGAELSRASKGSLSLSLSLHYAIPGTNFRVTRNVSCRFKVHITGCPIPSHYTFGLYWLVEN